MFSKEHLMNKIRVQWHLQELSPLNNRQLPITGTFLDCQKCYFLQQPPSYSCQIWAFQRMAVVGRLHYTCSCIKLYFMGDHVKENLTLLLLNTTCPVIANSVDPDQLASEEANWSGSALFAIKFVSLYRKPRSSNLIGWKLEVGMAS